MKSTSVLVLLFASACSLSADDSSSNLEQQAEHVSDCCKLEGSEIGREATLLRLGTKTVLVTDWVGKSGSSGEFLGFSITLGGGSTIDYVVKASTVKYPSSSLTWSHPGGGNAAGISNVDFCGECDNPDGCDGGGGGGDGGDGGGGDGGGDPPPCDNPDGCPDPGDGGPILY